MRASPEIELIVGVVLVANAAVTGYAALFRPGLLNHWFLRPRWFGAGGPLAGPVGAALGAVFWLGIGAWLIYLSVGRLVEA